jgi:hypothetical protein
MDGPHVSLLEQRVAKLEKQVHALLTAPLQAAEAHARETKLDKMLASIKAGPGAMLNAVSTVVQATVDNELTGDFKMARIDDPWCKRMRWYHSETGPRCLADVRVLPDATFEIAVTRVFGEPAVWNIKPSDLFAHTDWIASFGASNFKGDMLQNFIAFVSSVAKT